MAGSEAAEDHTGDEKRTDALEGDSDEQKKKNWSQKDTGRHMVR